MNGELVEVCWWSEDTEGTSCGVWHVEVPSGTVDPLQFLRDVLVAWASGDGADQVRRNGYPLNWGDLFDVDPTWLAGQGVRLVPSEVSRSFVVCHDEIVYDPDDVFTVA